MEQLSWVESSKITKKIQYFKFLHFLISFIKLISQRQKVEWWFPRAKKDRGEERGELSMVIRIQIGRRNKF